MHIAYLPCYAAKATNTFHYITFKGLQQFILPPRPLIPFLLFPFSNYAVYHTAIISLLMI